MKQKKDRYISSVNERMKPVSKIIKVPWDTAALGIEAYEILDVSESTIAKAVKKQGHYTIRVDPLFPKKILHSYNFYYCDTLVEPYCSKDKFCCFEHEDVNISVQDQEYREFEKKEYSFFHGRFHRDFNIDNARADLRYELWFKELWRSGNVFTLKLQGDLCGFFAYKQNKIVLHAMRNKYRGRGLSKYLWTAACKRLFAGGYKELVSSISNTNLSALNLYISLGFRFRKPVDIYHRLVGRRRGRGQRA